MPGLLQDLIKNATRGDAPERTDDTVSGLPGARYIDLLTTGQASETIRRSQAALTRTVIADARLA